MEFSIIRSIFAVSSLKLVCTNAHKLRSRTGRGAGPGSLARLPEQRERRLVAGASSHLAGGNLGASNPGRQEGHPSQTTMKPMSRNVTVMTIRLTAMRFASGFVERANVKGEQPPLL